MENKEDKSRFTRSCIAEALIQLLQEKSIEEITVTSLVKRAGCSRMTYYHYYETKIQVLEDYLYELVRDYTKEMRKKKNVGHFNDYMHIQYSFEFFGQYHEFFETLIQANLYSVIIKALNYYMEKMVLPEVHHTKYELFYYAGALCNTFVKWIQGGRQESAEEIAGEVYQLKK